MTPRTRIVSTYLTLATFSLVLIFSLLLSPIARSANSTESVNTLSEEELKAARKAQFNCMKEIGENEYINDLMKIKMMSSCEGSIFDPMTAKALKAESTKKKDEPRKLRLVFE